MAIATETLTGIRPRLLQRAYELSGSTHAGEDLVQEAYLRYLTQPPRPAPKTERDLLRWFRSVLVSIWADQHTRPLARR